MKLFDKLLDILGCGQGEEDLGVLPLTGGWHARYSKNVGYSPQGASLTVPQKGVGQIHYFMRSVSQPIKYNGVLMFRVKVDKDQDVQFYQDGTLVSNPTFRPILQRKKDDLTQINGRFWSNPQHVNLMGDGGIFNLHIPLNEKHWSNVFGGRSASGFRTVLKEPGSIGITFGGGGNFGHGLSCNGRCKVTILEYKFS